MLQRLRPVVMDVRVGSLQWPTRPRSAMRVLLDQAPGCDLLGGR